MKQKKTKYQTIRRGLQNHREQLACYAPDNCYSQDGPTVCKTRIRLRGRKEGAHVWMAKSQVPLQSQARSTAKVLSVAGPVFNLSDPEVSLSAKEFNTGQLWGGSNTFDVQFLCTAVVTTAWIHGY